MFCFSGRNRKRRELTGKLFKFFGNTRIPGKRNKLLIRVFTLQLELPLHFQRKMSRLKYCHRSVKLNNKKQLLLSDFMKKLTTFNNCLKCKGWIDNPPINLPPNWNGNAKKLSCRKERKNILKLQQNSLTSKLHVFRQIMPNMYKQ